MIREPEGQRGDPRRTFLCWIAVVGFIAGAVYFCVAPDRSAWSVLFSVVPLSVAAFFLLAVPLGYTLSGDGTTTVFAGS